MSEKKELNGDQLEKVAGGGTDVTVVLRIEVTYKPMGLDFTEKQIDIFSFKKKYTTYVSDQEIKIKCEEWCNVRNFEYQSHEVVEVVGTI